MLSTNQAGVKAAMNTTDEQTVALENKLEELSISRVGDKAAGSEEDKAEALRQLQEELKSLKASQKLMTELLSKSQEEVVTKVSKTQHLSPTVTFGENNSGFQAWTINGGVHGLTFGAKGGK